MAKSDLGKKLQCPNCGARFYDLKRQPAACPKCETEVSPQAAPKPRARREVEKPVKAPVPVAAAEEPDVEEAEEEEEDAFEIEEDDADLIEDTSELEDEEDVSEVKEHIEVDNTEEK